MPERRLLEAFEYNAKYVHLTVVDCGDPGIKILLSDNLVKHETAIHLPIEETTKLRKWLLSIIGREQKGFRHTPRQKDYTEKP